MIFSLVVASDGLMVMLGLLCSAIFALIWLALFLGERVLGQVPYVDLNTKRNIGQAVVIGTVGLTGYVEGVFLGGPDSGLIGILAAIGLSAGFSGVFGLWQNKSPEPVKQ